MTPIELINYRYDFFVNSISGIAMQDKPKQTIMNKISNAFKKFLNADLQAQVKAGYRNGELELTPEGRSMAIECLLASDTAAQAAFTAAANEVVAEAEKTK